MRTGIIGDELRFSRRNKIMITGIRDFNRRMQTSNRCADFRSFIRGRAWGEVLAHQKRKFKFGHPHQIALQGNCRPRFHHSFTQNASRHRALDANMGLTCRTGCGNFPTIERSGTALLQQSLNRIALGARGGPARGRQMINPAQGHPLRI